MNFMLQSSYVVVDIDDDGDLDIVANSTHGPFWLHRNNDVTSNSIQFQLRDGTGNSHCVGCHVTIRPVGDRSTPQTREIKSGGGFLSFDAPMVHFGLDMTEEIAEVEARWSTAEETVLRGPLPANASCPINRN